MLISYHDSNYNDSSTCGIFHHQDVQQSPVKSLRVEKKTNAHQNTLIRKLRQQDDHFHDQFWNNDQRKTVGEP